MIVWWDLNGIRIGNQLIYFNPILYTLALFQEYQAQIGIQITFIIFELIFIFFLFIFFIYL